MQDMPTMGKAISIRSPWPLFILYPGIFTTRNLPPKTIENRPKDITEGYRGPVFLHTGKEPDHDFYSSLEGCFKRNNALPDRIARLLPFGYPEWADEECQLRGGIVGVAQLTGVINPSIGSDNPWYVRGQYGLVLEDPQPLPWFPVRGYPWLFDIATAPILDLLRDHCCCCGRRELVEEGKQWKPGENMAMVCTCSALGEQCPACRKCKKHCLCSLIFPDLTYPEQARQAILKHILKYEILS